MYVEWYIKYGRLGLVIQCDYEHGSGEGFNLKNKTMPGP